MRKLQSFVAIVGHTAIRVAVILDGGQYTLRQLDGTIVTSLPSRVMTAAHLRWAMEQRELSTGHRSSLLATSTVGLPSHVWKETTDLFTLLERDPWGFGKARVNAVIAGLKETYAVETVEQAA